MRASVMTVLVLGLGCSGAPAPDAGLSVDAGPQGPADGGVPDGGRPADAGCEGACATTALTLTLGGRSAGFTRAQHGVDADGRLTVEAHFGGDPACPTMTSPTPERTLVIAGLQPRPDGGVVSFADGLRVTLLDFSGALTTAPLVRATAARATARFIEPRQLVSVEIEATFDGGRLSGGFAAPHCPSLDE
jgi:hypothetical protein